MGTFRYITHPFATRHQGCPHAAVRLACVKHAASVQSEPGSNSSVQSLFRLQCISASIISQNTDKVSSFEASLLSSVNVCFFSFATNKRPRLSSVLFLKIYLAFTTSALPTKRFVCHQHRNEIMNLFLILVNNFFNLFPKKFKPLKKQTLPLRRQLLHFSLASLCRFSREMKLWAFLPLASSIFHAILSLLLF